jgi:Tfp pilus assembly protein PilP
MHAEIKFEINREDSRAVVNCSADTIDDLEQIIRTVQRETRTKIFGIF